MELAHKERLPRYSFLIPLFHSRLSVPFIDMSVIIHTIEMSVVKEASKSYTCATVHSS